MSRSRKVPINGQRHGKFLRVDGMTWPIPAALSDLSWRLRFEPDSVTDAEKLVLASVIDAFAQMVTDGPRHSRTNLRSITTRKKQLESSPLVFVAVKVVIWYDV